jgi:hypothetical protein
MQISNRYTKLLEIELTLSQSTKDHFLIATICPTFTPAPLLTDRSSLTTHRRLTQFLIATNETDKIVVLMKRKEKQLSIRYKFASRGLGLPAAAGAPAAARQYRPIPKTKSVPHLHSNRNAPCLAVPVVLTCPAASGPIWFARLGTGA